MAERLRGVSTLVVPFGVDLFALRASPGSVNDGVDADVKERK